MDVGSRGGGHMRSVNLCVCVCVCVLWSPHSTEPEGRQKEGKQEVGTQG